MSRRRSFSERVAAGLVPLRALARDRARVVETARASGASHPGLSSLGDASLWALSLMRGAAALRGALGTSLGLSQVLRVGFHIDVWSDDIGGGLRLPHPFNVVIGDGAVIGEDCTLMHNVTVQRGAGTRIGDGVVLGTGTVVLAGASVGARALIGAASVVRGSIPPGVVAVGAPARPVRTTRPGEARPS